MFCKCDFRTYKKKKIPKLVFSAKCTEAASEKEFPSTNLLKSKSVVWKIFGNIIDRSILDKISKTF